MSDHRMIPHILAAIEHYGPMTCDQLAMHISLTTNSIYRNCVHAVEEKYLSIRRVKNGKKTGRRMLKFYRTRKQYVSPDDVPEVFIPQYRVEIVPFRDPLTAAFYGEYQREAA